MNRYILDTGILVGYVRGADFAKYCHETYDLSSPAHLVLTSIVTKGELLALAEKRNWGSKKREIYNQKLNEFPSVDISSDQVINAYARVKAWTEGSSPPSAPNFPPPAKPAKQMGQNDMWIAACAIASNSTIITIDKDFDHLAKAGILERIWIDQSSKPNTA